MKQILMVGSSGTLNTGQVEDQKMMKGNLEDRKKLLVCLKVNQLR